MLNTSTGALLNLIVGIGIDGRSPFRALRSYRTAEESPRRHLRGYRWLETHLLLDEATSSRRSGFSFGESLATRSIVRALFSTRPRGPRCVPRCPHIRHDTRRSYIDCRFCLMGNRRATRALVLDGLVILCDRAGRRRRGTSQVSAHRRLRTSIGGSFNRPPMTRTARPRPSPTELFVVSLPCLRVGFGRRSVRTNACRNPARSLNRWP